MYPRGCHFCQLLEEEHPEKDFDFNRITESLLMEEIQEETRTIRQNAGCELAVSTVQNKESFSLEPS